MKQKNLEKGKKGEEEAANFLKLRGFEIIDRNFRFKHTEIDLIAKDGNTVVFVEVKTRSSYDFGYPEEAINLRKIRNISKVCHYYITTHKIPFTSYRIDMISVMLSKFSKPEIKHYKNISGEFR